MYITSEEQLREVYSYPKGSAKAKQLPALELHAINFIAHSPFVTISSCSATGSVDCSLRGGQPRFVKVLSKNCLLIPDITTVLHLIINQYLFTLNTEK